MRDGEEMEVNNGSEEQEVNQHRGRRCRAVRPANRQRPPHNHP